jgi:hypothetical protein
MNVVAELIARTGIMTNTLNVFPSSPEAPQYNDKRWRGKLGRRCTTFGR